MQLEWHPFVHRDWGMNVLDGWTMEDKLLQLQAKKKLGSAQDHLLQKMGKLYSSLPPQKKKRTKSNMNSGSTVRPILPMAQCRLPGAERSAPHAQDLDALAVGNGWGRQITQMFLWTQQCQKHPKRSKKQRTNCGGSTQTSTKKTSTQTSTQTSTAVAVIFQYRPLVDHLQVHQTRAKAPPGRPDYPHRVPGADDPGDGAMVISGSGLHRNQGCLPWSMRLYKII